jgi:ABC-type dipeptide/oligopeptide/nickel transport system ATPase component
VGYVPQSPAAALNPRLSVGTLLDETWRAHSAERPAPDFYRSLLESVHLPVGRDFLAHKAGRLSTGQGQRLLIALGIMHNPALLIADEPTSALDAFISHDLLSVAALSHRVDILSEGRIVESGPPEQIFHRPAHTFTKELVAAMPRTL